MDPRSAFIATVEDLRSRSALTASEYDRTQAAGLIRRLVLDGQRLMDHANRTARLKIECEWHSIYRLTPGGFWIWDLQTDPAMYSTYLAGEGVADLSVLSRAPKRVKIGKFMREPVIIRKTDQSLSPDGEHVTVHAIIDEFANRRGGVHIDTARSTDPLLSLALTAPSFVHVALGVIGRVITRALEPLVAVSYIESLLEAEIAMMRLGDAFRNAKEPPP